MKNKFKKNIFYKVLIVIILLIGIISCNFLENKTIHIPKTIIQEKVDEKFPLTKNYLFAKLTLKNPKIDFKEKKMYVESDYEASLLDESTKGKVYMSTDIKYDTEKEELYLVDFAFDKIVDEHGIIRANSKLEESIKSLITNYLEKTPVYEYGKEYEEKNKDRKKKKIKIKNMYIKNSKFFVQT